MNEIEKSVLTKLVAMFRPATNRFLGHEPDEVIHGPNDRAMIGFDTHFLPEWLCEDFDFTRDEADWLISRVHGRAPE